MDPHTPRAGRDGDKPGKYELIDHVFESSVNPGDTVTIDLYMTGYGNITSSKLYFSPPPVLIFEEGEDSKVISGVNIKNVSKGDRVLKPNSAEIYSAPADGQMICWGGQSSPITRFGFATGIGEIKAANWREGTLYFDVNQGVYEKNATPSISTEAFMEGYPPVRIILKLKKKVRPGTYTMGFVLTYFNGDTWQNSSLRTSITIRNFFQRHEKAVAVIGIIAATGSSTGLLGLIPYAKYLYHWVAKLF